MDPSNLEQVAHIPFFERGHYRREMQQESKEHSQIESSGLLKLPAELKESIYDLCLKHEHTIDVSPTVQQPALLWTCKQIRQEALGNWCTKNRFNITICDCDDTLLKAFCKFAGKFKSNMHIVFSIKGRPDWANLKRWRKNVYEETSDYFGVEEDDSSAFELAVAVAHKVVVQHENDSWERCELALENVRLLLKQSILTWK